MIDKLLATVDRQLEGMDFDSVDVAMTISFEDHFAYQTIQSESFASGKITQDVAMFLFTTLGSTYQHFNRQPLAKRILAIQIIGLL